MGKGNISKSKKKYSDEEKKKSIKEIEAEDPIEQTIGNCFALFILDRVSRNASKATIDAYDRFYKKLKHMGEEMKVNVDDSPISLICGVAVRDAFILSLGNVSQQTINHYLRSYRAFGNYCEDQGYVTKFECPIKEIEPPPKDVYTESEIKALLKEPNIEDFVEYRDYAIVNLLLSTGARSNTILNIKLKDCDFEKGYINFTTTKAKTPMITGIEDSCLLVLRKYVARWRNFSDTTPDEYLFCNVNEEQLSRSVLCKSIAKYNNDRGVEKTSLHLFRHTYAKMWIQDGGDIITLAKVLNHKELDMVKRYSNLYGTDLKREIDQHSISAQIKGKKGKTLKTKNKI